MPVAVRRLVGHVVDARANVDDRAERGVSRDVVDTLAVHPHLAPVTKRRAVVIACPDHAGLPGSIGTRLGDEYARRHEDGELPTVGYNSAPDEWGMCLWR